MVQRSAFIKEVVKTMKADGYKTSKIEVTKYLSYIEQSLIKAVSSGVADKDGIIDRGLKLPNIGKFEIKHLLERKYRTPTGQIGISPPKSIVKFEPCDWFRNLPTTGGYDLRKEINAIRERELQKSEETEDEDED